MAKKKKRPLQRMKPPTSSRKLSLVVRARAIILGWLPVLAIFFGTRVLLAEAYRIPSGSMEPTLLVGDWLFVNNLRLGPHIPFTNHSLPGYAEPRRNEVVVFVSPPQDPSIRISPSDITPTLVKRIIAVAGDTILMRRGQLTVNGAFVAPRKSDQELNELADGGPAPIFGWQHRIEVRGSRFGEPVRAPSLHDWGPLVVPQGEYFMMGDNRDNSVDSRYYGTVPRANLRGTPMMVYYSYDATEGLEYLRAITAVRWSRLGTWIR